MTTSSTPIRHHGQGFNWPSADSLLRHVHKRSFDFRGGTYPFVELKLVEAFSGDLIDWVSARELDFAVVTKAEKVRGLKHTFLHRDHLVLISGPAVKLRNMQPALRELPPLKLMLPSRKQFLGETIYHDAVGSGR
jgi:DNA-binding transcriptional LysR family regulator